jgi:thymidylate synthase
MSKGFPALTYKKLAWKQVCTEFTWIINGNTNVQWLKDRKCNIWNDYEQEDGTVGKTYGYQLRNFNDSLDQLWTIADRLVNEPAKRNHILQLYNPLQLKEMSIPPCTLNCVHFRIIGDKLHMITYQRSADWLIGVPFDIAQAALLYELVRDYCAQKDLRLQPGTITYNFGSAHVYNNQYEVANKLIKEPFETYKLPTFRWKQPITTLSTTCLQWFNEDQYILEDYKSGPLLKIPFSA